MHKTLWKYLAILSICAWVCTIVGAVVLQRNTVSDNHVSTTVAPIVDQVIEDVGAEPVPEVTQRLTILAAGDIMLDRTMLLLAERNNDFGYSFRMISSTMQDADIRVANLEGPITTNKSTANIVNGGRGLSFTFSPKVTSTLKENFDILSLANNHTTNFGFDGLEQTKKFLDAAGIAWFGDPNNRADEKLSEIVEKNGIKIGFVGHHQLIETGFEHVIAEIKRIRPEVDVIIAYPHWGVEYVTSTPSALQKIEAHEMIDAGVDIIIGAHPHVIQPVEMYKDRLIFYSLGNFVFDQYFSLETMQGLLLHLALEKDEKNISTKINIIPVHINRQSQPFVADISERDAVLSSLATSSIDTDVWGLKESVAEGLIEFVLRGTIDQSSENAQIRARY